MPIEPGNPLPAKPRPSPQVVSSRLGDGGVLVHLHTNRIFELNATGFRAWELLGEGLDVASVERRLAEEYDAPADRVRRELEDLVGALLKEGLLDAAGEA